MQPAPAEVLTNQSPTLLTPPAIGATWPDQGGIYSGLIPGRLPGTGYHLITGPELIGTWDDVKAKATTVFFDGHQDFDLPYRDELELQFKLPNMRELFAADWCWSGEQYAANPVSAWVQDFANGNQDFYHKSNEYRVRLVRRILAIQ